MWGQCWGLGELGCGVTGGVRDYWWGLGNWGVVLLVECEVSAGVGGSGVLGYWWGLRLLVGSGGTGVWGYWGDVGSGALLGEQGVGVGCPRWVGWGAAGQGGMGVPGVGWGSLGVGQGWVSGGLAPMGHPSRAALGCES